MLKVNISRAAIGLSGLVRGCRKLAQRACGGFQGRLRATRAHAAAALLPTLFNPCRSLMPNSL